MSVSCRCDRQLDNWRRSFALLTNWELLVGKLSRAGSANPSRVGITWGEGIRRVA